MRGTLSIFLSMGLLAAMQTPLLAQDAVETDGFETSLSLGFTLTDGNSETTQANASLLSEGERDRLGSLRAGIEANYGESTVDDKTETTLDNLKLFAGARKTLSAAMFASLNGEYMYDNVADIDYRATISPGLGAYLWKTDSSKFSAEIGPAYVWEEVSGISDDYAALRIAERFDHRLSDTAKVWQSLEYLPKTDDFSAYLLTAEIGIEAAINSRVSLRLVLQDRYDSEPGEGNEENDLTFISGISVSL
jgi:putative salt-induced outer membrane protein YdiY